MRTGPGTAADGRSKFDLARFDEACFGRLRDRVIAAGDAGSYVAVMLFDGWGLHLSPAPDDVEVHPFRVAGHLDDHWASWLGDLTLARGDDGTSTLTGTVADQAQLHGVPDRLRDIGATLLAVHATGDTKKQPVQPAPPPALEHPLQTERLTLRPRPPRTPTPLSPTGASKPSAAGSPRSPTWLETYRATFAEPARLATTIVVVLDGHLIGDFMLRVEDGWAQAEVTDQARNTQAELGWVLDLTHTVHGYATEAVRALLTYCFDELNVRRVVANCFFDDDASWRLMERLGMRREVHGVAESLHRSGEWFDAVAYAILASEWEGRLVHGH